MAALAQGLAGPCSKSWLARAIRWSGHGEGRGFRQLVWLIVAFPAQVVCGIPTGEVVRVTAGVLRCMHWSGADSRYEPHG